MITLILLHPLQAVPVQSWTFETEPTVRIGRSTDNEVILYSAVVSRHHVEVKQEAGQWFVVNLGTNGTYIDGKRINQVPAEDGMVIRLASSGPKIQIRIDQSGDKTPGKSSSARRSATLERNDRSKDTLVNGEE